MTKLIHVKAGGGSVDEIGHFSPSFLWLLRDFYLDLRRASRNRLPVCASACCLRSSLAASLRGAWCLCSVGAQEVTSQGPLLTDTPAPPPALSAPRVRSEDGRPITPGDYLETALRAVAGKARRKTELKARARRLTETTEPPGSA